MNFMILFLSSSIFFMLLVAITSRSAMMGVTEGDNGCLRCAANKFVYLMYWYRTSLIHELVFQYLVMKNTFECVKDFQNTSWLRVLYT